MQIGVIGTGSVGTALARGLAASGHDVVVGSRDPGTPSVDGDAGGIAVGSHREAVEHGSAVVLATPPGVAVDLAGEFAEALTGTTVVDPTNEYPGPSGERSVAERIAAAAPEAAVVKAFNTIGAEHMTDPTVGGMPATMFVAGPGEAAELVAGLAADLGFDPFVVGDLRSAGHLEHLARFWIDLANDHGRDLAFRFLRE